MHFQAQRINVSELSKVGPQFSEFVKKNKPKEKKKKKQWKNDPSKTTILSFRNLWLEQKIIVKIKREFGDFKETL